MFCKLLVIGKITTLHRDECTCNSAHVLLAFLNELPALEILTVHTLTMGGLKDPIDLNNEDSALQRFAPLSFFFFLLPSQCYLASHYNNSTSAAKILMNGLGHSGRAKLELNLKSSLSTYAESQWW